MYGGVTNKKVQDVFFSKFEFLGNHVGVQLYGSLYQCAMFYSVRKGKYWQEVDYIVG